MDRDGVTVVIPAYQEGSRLRDVVVTLDAEGEHDPRDVDRLVESIDADEADLVFGVCEAIPRPSERLLNYLLRPALSLRDTGTGFRPLRTDLDW